jgi:hypothetical protein
MKKLLILSFALVVLAGCKGSVPQADYVAPARTATGAANSSPPEMKYICQSAKRGETPSTGDCARNWFSAVVNSREYCSDVSDNCRDGGGILLVYDRNLWRPYTILNLPTPVDPKGF